MIIYLRKKVRKMRIGILTFHNTTNYGAIFQTFALQKYVNEQGVKCDVIDYNNNTLMNRYNINPFHSKNLKEFAKKSLLYRDNKRLKKAFLSFTEENISMSGQKYNENNIKDADNIYDSFIAGSDQIWNFDLSGKDKNYFMIFSSEKKKRNSYAASIGKSSLSHEEEQEFKELLNQQNNISVRENQGRIIIDKIDNTLNPECHIDPTFLVKQDEWIKLLKGNKPKYKYIFVYEVSITDNLRMFAKYLAEKTGFKIIFISGTSKNIMNAKKIKNASPEEFLNFVYNAEYVITSSFHGMALSLIFNKEFFYDTPSNSNSLGSRLDNLASILKVSNRKITTDFNHINTDKINYNEVNKMMKVEIKRSQEYLNKIIFDK